MIGIILLISPPAHAKPSSPIATDYQQLFTGDLQEMKKRHVIRVLVTHSKTNFFLVKGEPHGFEYELLQQYGKFLNKKVSRKNFRTNVVFIPVPFEQLLSGLIEGKGDITAAGLTITPEREKIIAFSDSYLPRVEEVVVMRKKLKGLTTIEALAGRSVFIIRGGSYGPHLDTLNTKFAKKGLSPINITEASEYLATEDLLGLVNTGVIDLAVADRHIAELWAPVLPKISVRPDLTIHSRGKIGWAVRQGDEELHNSLNSFIRRHKKGTLLGNILFKRYYQDRKWISNPLEARERKKIRIIYGPVQKVWEEI